MTQGRVTRTLLLLGIVAAVHVGTGCSRGLPRDKRPVQVIPDMEFQPKYKAQGESPLFADGRSMRTPPEGTVARGTLKEDTAFFEGKSGDAYLVHNPRPVTVDLLHRGRERFDIYCSPCHDRTGSGKGMVVPSGLVPPPSFHEDRIVGLDDGYLFEVITKGVRTMPSYSAQIPAGDRWAIVAYVRALQRSQRATLDDVPAESRKELE